MSDQCVAYECGIVYGKGKIQFQSRFHFQFDCHHIDNHLRLVGIL